jgi:hypothetical protein
VGGEGDRKRGERGKKFLKNSTCCPCHQTGMSFHSFRYLFQMLEEVLEVSLFGERVE